MHVLGVDPGGTTGVVLLDVEHWQVLFAGELSFSATVEYLYAELIDRIPPAPDVVAFEKFTITQRTLKLTRQYEALELIGIGRAFCQLAGIEFVRPQTSSDAKTVWNDDRLHYVHLYDAVRGGHARDALRHALLCAQRKGRVPALT